MAKSKKEKQPRLEPRLTREELVLISQVLFNSRWTGQEWQNRITPLINKLARMIDGLTSKQK